MKLSKYVAAIALVSLVSVAGFARNDRRDDGQNQGPNGGGTGPNFPRMEMSDGGMGGGGMMREFSDYVVIFKLAGIPMIMEKYNIQIDKEMLSAREKKLALIEKRMALHDQILTLVNAYTGSADQQAKIIDLIKQMTAIQKQIEDINAAAMARIDQINQNRRTEVDAAVEKWIKLIQTDQTSFNQFVDMMRNRPRMDDAGAGGNGPNR